MRLTDCLDDKGIIALVKKMPGKEEEKEDFEAYLDYVETVINYFKSV
jgi:hypothetical protein